MNEEWRNIPGIVGYQASSEGRIRSVDRQIDVAPALGRVSSKRLVRGTVLRPEHDRRGYLQVRLGRKRRGKVHSLVAQAFHGPRPLDMEACHTDGNSQNNRPSNVRWDTTSANKLDTVRHGTHVQARKTRCKRQHLLTEPNLTAWSTRGGKRSCLACHRARDYVRRHPTEEMQTEADRIYAELNGTWAFDTPGPGGVRGGGRR